MNDLEGPRSHHEAAIRLLADHAAGAGWLAVVVTGSVATGRARADSDIDAIIVVTDEEYQDRAANGELFFYSTELAPYPGGYIDGKVVSVDMLNAAVVRGNEPMRASFRDSRIVWSRLDELELLVERIGSYPEAGRTERCQSYLAQAHLFGTYFLPHALRKSDPYLTQYAVSRLVLFAGRLLLADQRILFRSHKDLLADLAGADGVPAGMVDSLHTILDHPAEDAARSLVATLAALRPEWRLSPAQTISRFIRDVEWAWYTEDQPPDLY
jgi:hypothetical protein